MLTACGAQNSNVGQESPIGLESPVVVAPDKTEIPNDNVQMTSPAVDSRISVAGTFRLSASIEHPAGINDVEFILGEYDRIYLKLGLKGVPSLQIDQMIDLKKCIAITVTPGRKPIRAIIHPKTGPKIEVSIGMVDLY
jgi:hypothetical protein